MPFDYDPYEDPELAPPEDNSSDFPETVQFKRPGDSIRATILDISKVVANGRVTALFHLQDMQGKRWSMFVGESPKDLKRQVWKLTPQRGDVIEARLLEIMSETNFKRFEVSVEKGGSTRAQETVAPQRVSPAPARSASQMEEDESSIFDS